MNQTADFTYNIVEETLQGRLGGVSIVAHVALEQLLLKPAALPGYVLHGCGDQAWMPPDSVVPSTPTPVES